MTRDDDVAPRPRVDGGSRKMTPGMLRTTLADDDLADFTSLGFDDQVKIFAPTPSGEVERRDDTPCRYDPLARTLVIDFALHDAGPATCRACSG